MPVFPEQSRAHVLLYKIVYKPHSRKVHGDSYPYRKQLRYAEHAEDYAKRTALLMRHAIRLIVANLMPDQLEDVRTWYQEIEERSSQFWDLS